jgi:hypothetical protein
MERRNRSKESFENELKLEMLLERARDRFHESQFWLKKKLDISKQFNFGQKSMPTGV